jgi:hypothetical protein
MSMSLELSDTLEAMRRQLSEFEHEGCWMDAEAVATTLRLLRDLTLLARQLENEVSRLRWNEPALRQQIAEARVVAEAQRPDTNLRLFPAPHRPFDDGRGSHA